MKSTMDTAASNGSISATLDASVIAFVRFALDRRDFIVFCCKFTPVRRYTYRIGVPRAGVYREILTLTRNCLADRNLGNGGW